AASIGRARRKRARIADLGVVARIVAAVAVVSARIGRVRREAARRAGVGFAIVVDAAAVVLAGIRAVGGEGAGIVGRSRIVVARGPPLSHVETFVGKYPPIALGTLRVGDAASRSLRVEFALAAGGESSALGRIGAILDARRRLAVLVRFGRRSAVA